MVQLVFFQKPAPLLSTEAVTNQSLGYRTLAVYKSVISLLFPVGENKLGDLPLVSRFWRKFFVWSHLRLDWAQPGMLSACSRFSEPWIHLLAVTLKMLSLILEALLALTSSAHAHELIRVDLDFVSVKSDSWEFSLAEHKKLSRLDHPTRKNLCLLSQDLRSQSLTGESI